MKSSLESKTIRPGLMAYSFYRSDRHPASRRVAEAKKPRSRPHYRRVVTTLIVLAVLGVGVLLAAQSYASYRQNASNSSNPQAAAVADGPKECSGNSLKQFIIVSIHERHMWACQYHKVIYDAPVVTGMENLPADLTPQGAYHIYDKQTNTTLTGSDTTGNWSDPVHYWMPFLQNQYGQYGFHDATWRKNSDFGNIDPHSSNASHGCVEMPLAASQWLYNWANVGTTVTIKS